MELYCLSSLAGGFYERLVGMIKGSLKKAVRRKGFTLEQWITPLVEVEAVLNSRPLTYVYDDLDSGFVLTPSCFLIANRELLGMMMITMKMLSLREKIPIYHKGYNEF